MIENVQMKKRKEKENLVFIRKKCMIPNLRWRNTSSFMLFIPNKKNDRRDGTCYNIAQSVHQKVRLVKSILICIHCCDNEKKGEPPSCVIYPTQFIKVIKGRWIEFTAPNIFTMRFFKIVESVKTISHCQWLLSVPLSNNNCNDILERDVLYF